MNIKTVLDTGVTWLHDSLQAVPSIIKPNVFEAETLLNISLKNDRYIIRAVRTLLACGNDNSDYIPW